MGTHVYLINSIKLTVILGAILTAVKIWIQDLFYRNFTENLKVHERQEVRLIVLMLCNLGMIIN